MKTYIFLSVLLLATSSFAQQKKHSQDPKNKRSVKELIEKWGSSERFEIINNDGSLMVVNKYHPERTHFVKRERLANEVSNRFNLIQLWDERYERYDRDAKVIYRKAEKEGRSLTPEEQKEVDVLQRMSLDARRRLENYTQEYQILQLTLDLSKAKNAGFEAEQKLAGIAGKCTDQSGSDWKEIETMIKDTQKTLREATAREAK